MSLPLEPSSPIPSDGERRAIRGYSAQYTVAATIIYDALLIGELEWIHVADPEAGRLDDLIVARPGRLDAYQIKWQDYEERITFRYLVTNNNAEGSTYPSPIKLLADGWRQLVKIHPDRVVQVHYLTRSSASSSDDTGGQPTSGPRHLQAFLRHAFPHCAMWAKSHFAAQRHEWRAPIEEMEAASGLSTTEQERFFAACKLDLGFKLDHKERPSGTRRTADITALAQFIQQTVASELRTVQVTRAELLRALGWTNSFEFTFRHDFPVDERLFRPIRSTVEALEYAFTCYSSGYLALVGPPGSGKSTTLTQMLRYRQGVRTVRYYAFVRGDVRQGRGEAEAFLHDLCLALEEQGVGRTYPRPEQAVTSAELRDRLGELLKALNEDWRETGTRTIILVDGLDHIEREQSPTRSLIEELPHPATIPEGVIIILGTQQSGLETAARAMRPVRVQLEERGRTIQMARLERGDVYSIATEAVLGDLLSEGDIEQIYMLSGGHPLALSYLIKRVAALEDRASVQYLLNDTTPYTDDIEAEYRTYWDSLRGDIEVRNLLGLICRLRGSVELEILEILSSPEVLQRFVAAASHYFMHETPYRWTFFHNSFRQYLLRVTGRDAFNRLNPQLEREFHKRLADAAMTSRGTSPFAWEHLYHLAKAGETDAILSTFTQKYFRDQFFALRPLLDIRDDINLCVTAAAERQDWIAVIRAILITQELTERDDALSEADLQSLVLELAEKKDVADKLLDGLALRVPSETALTFAGRLLDSGEEALARRSFDAAEPLDLLSGVQGLEPNGRSSLLDAWVRVAWRFRPLDTIFAALASLRVDSKTSPMLLASAESEAEIALRARVQLLVELGTELVECGKMELLAVVKAEIRRLAAEGSDDRLAPIEFAVVRAAIEGKLPREIGSTTLAGLLASTADPLPSYAVWLADLVLGMTVDRDEAERLMKFAPQPLRVTSFGRSDDETLGPEASLLVQARNLARLGRPMDAVKAIPNIDDERSRGITLYQRMIVLIGTTWGEGMSGKRITPDVIVRRLRPAFAFFQRSFDETNEWSDWYIIERRAPAFYRVILRAALAHGKKALDAILHAFFEDFRRPASRQYPGWRLSWKQSILLSAFDLDGDKTRTVTGLNQLESEIDIDHELQDRIAHHRAHLLARLSLSDRDHAAIQLSRMLATSFGVYHREDDQLTRWSRWAARYSEQVKGLKGKAALLQILNALPVQHRNYRGDDRGDETEILITAATKSNPAWGYSVADWLLNASSAERSYVYSGLVGGCLDDADAETLALAAIVTARLIVPFEASTASALPSKLCVALNKSNSEAVVSACDVLRRCADVKSLPSTRTSWAGPLNLTPAPLPPTTEPDDKLASSEREHGLVLSNGSWLTPEEVKAFVSDPESLSNLLSEAIGASGINWTDLLSRILPEITNGYRIRSLREHIDRLGSSIQAEAALAVRAGEIGERTLAAEILASMFAHSNRYGWMRRYDGGTRLVYAHALVAIDGDAGRQMAAALFARDYIEGLSARDLLFSLDPILAVIFEKVPIEALWQEFSEHAAQLAEISESQESAPETARAEHLDAKAVLIRLLFSDMESPVLSLAEEARKGITDLIRLGTCLSQIEEELHARLQGDDAAQMSAAALLMCAVEERPQWVQVFSANLLDLAWSPSEIIRHLVQGILSQLQVPIPKGPPEKPLPAIFQLHLPEAHMRERGTRGDAPPRCDPLPDTVDPIDLARLFSSPLERISKASGLSYEALANRLAALMRQLQPTKEWSQQAEHKLRVHLDAIELKATFRRPRSLVSLRAFSHLVAELVDGNVLPCPYHEIDEWLLTVDPLLGRLDPVAKPTWLELPPANTLGKYPADQWIANAGDALDLAARMTPEGGLVLGEYTSVDGLSHERPREARASVIRPPAFPKYGEREPCLNWFSFCQRYVAAEYPSLFRLKPTPVTVLAGGPYFAHAEFLALNPLLALHLGWRSAGEGLFRWNDNSGTLMVESIWWQKGNRTLLGAHGYEEATAEGWLVVATEAALPLLQDPLKNFRRYLTASRKVDGRQRGTCSNVIERAEDLGTEIGRGQGR